MHFAMDVTLVTLLIHASGGISSGLGGVLIVSTGTLALLVPRQRAFLFAAVSRRWPSSANSPCRWCRVSPTAAQFGPAGILGAVVFVITGVVQLLRHRIVETEALAEQRGVDLRNLAELNEYIIQHLRESIVVIDDDDRVRLINESAAKHLGTDPVGSGLPIARSWAGTRGTAERLASARAAPNNARRHRSHQQTAPPAYSPISPVSASCAPAAYWFFSRTHR
jgi:two-component system, NtrC family, sensor histidine kinase PilS